MTEETLKAIEAAIALVEHPEIGKTLVQLGMIDDLSLREADHTVTLTLLLPTLGIPEQVLDFLANSLYMATQSQGWGLEVNVKEMDDAQREHFFSLARANWKGTM